MLFEFTLDYDARTQVRKSFGISKRFCFDMFQCCDVQSARHVTLQDRTTVLRVWKSTCYIVRFCSSIIKSHWKINARTQAHIEKCLKITDMDDIEKDLLTLIQTKQEKNARVNERRKTLAITAQKQNKTKELRLTKFVPHEKINIRTSNTSIRFAESDVKLCCVPNCDTCSSFGMSEYLMTCTDCGISRHTFCAHIPISSSSEKARTHWRCEFCATCCELCESHEFEERTQQQRQLSSRMAVRCSGCRGVFHAGCMDPPMVSVEDSERWFCSMCIDCKSCNKVMSDSRHWSLRIDSCSSCDDKIRTNKDTCVVCRQDTGLLDPFVRRRHSLCGCNTKYHHTQNTHTHRYSAMRVILGYMSSVRT